MFGFPILEGWLMHFMIGIIFAMMYVFVIRRILKKIRNTMWKGTIFGVFAFLFGQIMDYYFRSSIYRSALFSSPVKM